MLTRTICRGMGEEKVGRDGVMFEVSCTAGGGKVAAAKATGRLLT